MHNGRRPLRAVRVSRRRPRALPRCARRMTSPPVSLSWKKRGNAAGKKKNRPEAVHSHTLVTLGGRVRSRNQSSVKFTENIMPVSDWFSK